MMISSNVDQPTFCATLNAVGSHEPRCPSGARRTTIPGTRASAPIAADSPSKTFPATAPTRIASSAAGSESAGTSRAPITITRSETERFPQSSSESSAPSTCSRSGTGLIPQLGVRSSIGGECTDLRGGKSKTVTSAEDLFRVRLRQMLYVEAQLADEVLPRLRRDAHSTDLRYAFERHLAETEAHVDTVRDLLGAHAGPEPSPAFDAVVAEHDRLLERVPAGDAVAADLVHAMAAAATEHLELAAYDLLSAMAE